MGHLYERGFQVREAAWHGLGTTVADYPGLDEAMKLAGHDHQIVTVPIQEVGSTSPMTGWKAIKRQDTGHVISVMNASYEVIQNRVPWELIDTLFSQGAKWDTAGILKGRYDEANKEVKGQVYWCLSLLDEPNTVNGDNSPTYPYLAATWSHDGSQSLRIRAMSVRIVCANTHGQRGFSKQGLMMNAEYFSKLRPFNCCMNHIHGIPVIGFGSQTNRHGRSIIYQCKLPPHEVEHFDLELIGEHVKVAIPLEGCPPEYIVS